MAVDNHWLRLGADDDPIRSPRLRRSALARSGLSAAVALALLTSACGGSEPDAAAGGAATTAVDAGTTVGGDAGSTVVDADGGGEVAAPSLFPDVAVTDLANQAEINLAQTLAGGDTPVLLWFWAPH